MDILERILKSEPINKTASLVTNQSGCNNRFTYSPEELEIAAKQCRIRILEIRTELGLLSAKTKKVRRAMKLDPELRMNPLALEWLQLASLENRIRNFIASESKRLLATDFSDCNDGDTVYVHSKNKVYKTTICFINSKRKWFRVALFKTNKYNIKTGFDWNSKATFVTKES